MRRETDEMKLTAYALGELAAAEREAVESRLADSPQDRQFVEEVRATARLVFDELARETTASLNAIHYAAIEMRLREPNYTRPIDRREIIRGRIGLALSLAASIAIVCAAVGAALLMLSRHHDLATNIPAPQPSTNTILIPLEHLNLGGSQPGHSVAQAQGAANPFVSVSDRPVSSFAMNTEIGSYEDFRRALFNDRIPSRESVRIEGMINAFAYDYPSPEGNAAFAGQIEIGTCPWQSNHRLARIAIKARPGTGLVATNARTEIAFSPASIKSYRLIGYEDAAGDGASGEDIVAGHAVTALYEIVPVAAAKNPGDGVTLSVHFHQPAGASEQVIQFAGQDRAGNSPTTDFRFAAAVAEFGMTLRDSIDRGKSTIDSAIELAESGRGSDLTGERRQFIELARRTKELLG